jgi:hypothetical protein
MQCRLRSETKPPHIPCVWRNLRLNQDDVEQSNSEQGSVFRIQKRNGMVPRLYSEP